MSGWSCRIVIGRSIVQFNCAVVRITPYQLIMRSLSMKLSATLCIFAMVALVGCASTSMMQAVIAAPKAQAFSATVKVLVKNGYQVAHTDRKTGIIAADRPIKQAITGREGGGMIRVTVLIEETNGTSVINTTWTPPDLATGSFETEYDEFLRGLAAALPGVQIK